MNKENFDKLLNYLKKNGISKTKEMSEATGLPQSTISDYMQLIKTQYTFYPIEKKGEKIKYVISLKALIKFIEEKGLELDRDRVLLLDIKEEKEE